MKKIEINLKSFVFIVTFFGSVCSMVSLFLSKTVLSNYQTLKTAQISRLAYPYLMLGFNTPDEMLA
ncbi:MAG: hypothetical protein ACRBEE_09255 [Arenicella sp.]